MDMKKYYKTLLVNSGIFWLLKYLDISNIGLDFISLTHYNKLLNLFNFEIALVSYNDSNVLFPPFGTLIDRTNQKLFLINCIFVKPKVKMSISKTLDFD